MNLLEDVGQVNMETTFGLNEDVGGGLRIAQGSEKKPGSSFKYTISPQYR